MHAEPPVTDFESETGVGRDPLSLVVNELAQARYSGRDTADLLRRFDEIDKDDIPALTEIYRRLRELPGDPGLFEQSDLPSIEAVLPPAATRRLSVDAHVEDQIRGAWHGRIIGNMFGKPVEVDWPRLELRRHLEKFDSYPMRDYVPVADPARAIEDGFSIFTWLPNAGLLRGLISGGVRDDDIDYAILGLHLVETYGLGYTTRDVAREWLTRIPAFQTYTAERVAYQNVARWVPLSEVGSFENPYREWIGALIRADIFGYVNPGDPRAAALLAHADAFLSHRSNGLYGAMWAAALVSSAFTAESPEASVAESLRHIPSTSLLAREVQTILDAHRDGQTWEEAMSALEERYPDMHWVHILNNAGALTAAVLWGDGDFAATAGLAAQAGLDADSIGATAGSWAGAFVGFDALPSHLVDPIDNTIESAIFGYPRCSIDDLASRTTAIIRTLA